MSSYLNCYEILSDLRREINEYSTALVQGTDTSGAYSNAYLVRKINDAQGYLYSMLLNKKPEIFLKSTTITGVASVFALPADFGTLLVFKDDENRKIFPINIDKLKIGTSSGNSRLYYRKGSDLVMDKDGITDTYTLWYYWRCRDLDTGTAAAGAATSITLATTAKPILNYYTGMDIEDITQSFVNEITAYTAARVATITGTAVAADYYGIVPELPEPFRFLIASRAALTIKAKSPIYLDKTNIEAEYKLFYDEFNETFKAYAGSKEDIDQEEIWMDLEATGPRSPGIVQSS